MGRAAVTGASGFIGSAVARRLVEAGREVRALVQPGVPAPNLRGLDVEQVPVDVVDGPAMARALEGCASLFHLAAVYKTWTPDPEPLYRVNVEGTVATLLAAQRAKVERVVYTSSIAALGLVEGGEADEETPFNLFDVANPYILTKWQSERVALRFAAMGMNLVVVNPSFPFGPGDSAPTPTGRIVLSVLNGEVPGYGPGGFNAVDVDDCAAGHLLAEAKGRAGQRYILGGENVDMKRFFTLVAKAGGVRIPRLPIPGAVGTLVARGMEVWSEAVSGKEPTATVQSLRYAQRGAYFSTAKARRELGFQTRPLDETVARAVAWFRAQSATPLA